MLKHTKLCTGLLIAFGGLAIAPGVMAQDATMQRVEITGSRIKTINTDGASPVVTLSAAAIKASGVRTAEELLNGLPQVMADFGASVSNGATGTATVNLRNLGASRTLVLVNGRRLPAGSPRSVAADLNQIPVSMIERIEVLTGGASAVYGADAVAGVVNFILKNNFQGIEFDVNHSFFNHQQGNSVAAIVEKRGFAVPGDKSADGAATEFSMTIGGNFADNKGNAVINLTHKRENALLQSERDFSACALNPSGDGKSYVCGGSSTSFPGRFITGAGNLTVADAAGNTRPWVSATDIFNFGPTNYFQRPSDRYSVTALAHYDINNMARVYTQLAFHDDSTVAQIAPSGLFGFDASGVNAVKFGNPLLSADWRAKLGLTKAGDTADVLILRRNVEGGGRQDHLRHTSYRTVAGVKGDIGAWSYDAFAQLGRVVYQETYKNDFSITRTARAMDVVTDPATGKAVCASALNGTDPNCVPYNIWALGKIDPAALAYLATPGFQKGFTEQAVFGASLSADLTAYGMKLPMAKEGVGVSFGLEHRTERLELETDAAFSSGDLAGQGGPTFGVAGKYSVKDVFGEVRVPIASRQPFAYDLNLNASYRHSAYSSGNSTNTYGTGVEWSPIKEVKLRGSHQQAARSPNVVELFTPAGAGLFNMDSDPCAGATPTASLAQCQRTGVTAALYGGIPDSTAGQYNALYGGNTNLKPEVSKSNTFGFVVTPIKNLNLSIDYFSIDVEDAIGVLPPTTTLTQCLETGNPKFCSLITRDRLGSLWATPAAQVIATNLNIASFGTRGIDFGADYAMGLGSMGKLDLSFLGTYTKKFTVETVPGLGSYDCAGLFGSTCGNPHPTWRHKLRTSWVTPWGMTAGLTWRHFDSVNADVTSDNPQLKGTVREVQASIPSRDYLDVSMSYKIMKNVTLNGSINNLLDKDPPVLNTGAPFGNGNTYPGVYDALGRKISLSMTAKF